jgi:branched-chain amino acid transport system ATP-binding protein
VLSLSNLNVSIASVHILRGVSLELAAGSMTGLIGRNGAGKTTLIKTVMGLLKAGSGSVRFEDKDLLAVPTHARARLGIGYMPEDRRLIPDLTVEENILLPAWAAGIDDARARWEKILEYVPEIRELAPRKGAQLSGGQQKLAALARALMCGTRLLLLDEPFEGVAPAPGRGGARPQGRGPDGDPFGVRPAAFGASGRSRGVDRPRLDSMRSRWICNAR